MAAELHDGVNVRYACKCGRLAPARALFFSDLVQRPVCRRPGCSVEEFESFYCGQLLVNLPSKEASLYQNRSSRCFCCAACGGALSTAFHEAHQRYFFLCAHCRWDSLALGLAEEDPDTLVMATVARERESAHEDVFNVLLAHHSSLSASTGSAGGSARGGTRPGAWQTLADSRKELQREQQMNKSRLHRTAEMGGWRVDQAQARDLERAQWLVDQRRENAHPLLANQLARLPQPPTSTAERDLLVSLAQQRDMDAVSSLPQRLLNPLDQPRDAALVSPSRPPLRAKRTWRCVESIERGSAGILVKPQISPMSGDSSLPVASSWFKKANLAVHYLPIVTFQRLPWRQHGSELVQTVLLVENPLDDPVRLVLRASQAPTECSDGFVEDAQVTPSWVRAASVAGSVADGWSGALAGCLGGVSAGHDWPVRRPDPRGLDGHGAQPGIYARWAVRQRDGRASHEEHRQDLDLGE